ncbi:hypothetical protein F4778DRAFT_743458 [Xylariomycetidae sp. FL2044]|nr:hypothetical protein F4778DRAFT_743458 [Xylariomycetidae sp. FL2044]
MAELRICVPRHCGLCQFDFQLDDPVVAISEHCDATSPFPYGSKFQDGTVAYVECFSSCHCPWGRAYGCHASCVRYQQPRRTLRETLAMTAYAFEPPLSRCKERVDWLLRNAASNICLRPDIPPELRFEIARSLLPEYAASNLAAICQHHTAGTSVDISATVYARRISFEGVPYIASLANKAGDGNEEVTALTTTLSQLNTVFVCEDHLGIREIVLGHSAQALPVDSFPGLWWRTLTSSSTTKLCGYTDGLKLRKLAWSNDADDPSDLDVSCDIPIPVDTEIRFHRVDRRVSSRRALRMASFVCNDPSTYGYSFGWDQGVRYIHAHTAYENPSFYQYAERNYKSPIHYHHPGEDVIWLYMPIRDGEFITEFWHCLRYLPVGFALLLKTNTGNTTLIGEQPQPHWWPVQWTLVDRPASTPSRIFFEDSPGGIEELGFETSLPTQLEPYPVVPSSTSLHPKTIPLRFSFLSSAALDDVVQITICRSTSVRGPDAIIGVLFDYANGSQACVGQFRFDSLDRPLRV